MELEARNVPPDLSQDCGIARRCKLFLGTELERGALVQEDPFLWPPMERRGEFEPANLQAESYLGLQRVSKRSTVRSWSVGLVPINALLFTNIASTPEWRPIGSYCWLARGRIVGYSLN
jgi:hypothetical protein